MRAGNSFHDLREIKVVDLEEPKGWVHFALTPAELGAAGAQGAQGAQGGQGAGGAGQGDYLRAYFIQLAAGPGASHRPPSAAPPLLCSSPADEGISGQARVEHAVSVYEQGYTAWIHCSRHGQTVRLRVRRGAEWQALGGQGLGLGFRV